MSKTPQQIEADKAAKKAADEAARKAVASQDDETDDEEEVADEGEETDENQEADPDDKELGFSDKQKAYLKKLRDENAKHRSKARALEDRFGKLETGLKSLFGGEDDDKLTPEQKVEKLSQEKEALAFNQSLAEAAIEFGVGKESLKYFKFLVAQKAEELGEGEEITEDDLKLLAKEANGRSGKTSSSVSTGSNNTPDPDEEDGEITIEEFKAMGVVARSALYQKDKALYERMVAKERDLKKKR